MTHRNVTTVQVANYANKGGNHKGKRKLMIFADADWVDSHFGEKRLSFRVQKDGDGYEVYVEENKDSSYRWGKLLKGDRRSIGIVHNELAMPLFGSTTIEADSLDKDELHQVLTIRIPSDVQKPIKRIRRKQSPAPQVDIRLRDAIRAINNHKETMGEELCLSIEPDGSLLATLQYS